MKNTGLLMGCLCVACSVFAGNPMVPDVGMADPHIYVFNNKVYLFTTRDSDPTAKRFMMPDWHIWTSEDLIDWKLERTIFPSETYMGPSTSCWATDTAFKDGSYYFYFSNGNTNTGVMKASSPTGPYVDVLGKPLLPADLTPTKEYDPSVLVDDDGSAYIVFGHYRAEDPNLFYAIAKLGKDMISLGEIPKEIKMPEWGMKGNDKPEVHKKNGLYYLSAGSNYGTSGNIYGPYAWRGNSGNDNYGLGNRAHGNFFEWNNQSFHVWCKFITDTKVKYRDSCMSYMHYRENGDMVTDTGFLDAHYATGIGQYDATWDTIQAEWYMAAEGAIKRDGPNGGFVVQASEKGARLSFPNVKNLRKNSEMSFSVASASGGTIEVRSGAKGESLLGRCSVPPTGGMTTYQSVGCTLTNAPGDHAILLRFFGTTGPILNLDWFTF